VSTVWKGLRADCLQDRRSEKCALLGMPACLSAAGAQHQPPPANLNFCLKPESCAVVRRGRVSTDARLLTLSTLAVLWTASFSTAPVPPPASISAVTTPPLTAAGVRGFERSENSRSVSSGCSGCSSRKWSSGHLLARRDLKGAACFRRAKEWSALSDREDESVRAGEGAASRPARELEPSFVVPAGHFWQDKLAAERL